MRVLYLFETATGIGHQQRARFISNALPEDSHITIASGSFVNPEQYFRGDIRLIRLPENRRRKGGMYWYFNAANQLVCDPHHNEAQWQASRAEAIHAYASQAPLDIVVVEWWPWERRKQFDGVVDTILKLQAERFNRRPLVISTTRDIPLSGNLAKREEAIAHAPDIVAAINDRVDYVLVHADPELIRLEDGFPQAGEITKPVIYTGYVADRIAAANGMRNNNIIISCGSGDEGRPFLEAVLSAIPYSNVLQQHTLIFVCGPRMQENDRSGFSMAAQKLMEKYPVNIKLEVPDLPAHLATSAFSISMGGYNTTMEVLASGIPHLLIPKFSRDGLIVTKMSLEQRDRLQKLMHLGKANIAHPGDVIQPDVLGNLIDQSFEKRLLHAGINMEGATRTVKFLHDVVHGYPVSSL